MPTPFTRPYVDLLIRIGAQLETNQSYPVEAILNDGSFYFGGELYLDQVELNANIINPEAYGTELFTTLFTGPIGRAYNRALGLAESDTEGRLRVRMWIDNRAAELQAIRWERLFHSYRGQTIPLGISEITPFSRYIGLEIAEAPPLETYPLNMLIVVSNPTNLPKSLVPVDVDAEVNNLYEALSLLDQTDQNLAITVMPGRTGLSATLTEKLTQAGWSIQPGFNSLEHIMRYAGGCDLLHFVGHGAFRRRGKQHGPGEAVLYLESSTDGRSTLTKDQAIINHITGLNPVPQMVFLSACETTKRNDNTEHAFVGLGPKLVQAGIPAVIAMQDVIPIRVARALAYDFYWKFQAHGIVDLALNQARLLLFNTNDNAWDIPVLFMRSFNGTLISPNPLHIALSNIYYHPDYYFFCPASKQYLPFPVEVIHRTGDQDLNLNEANIKEATATIDLLTATMNIFEYHQNIIAQGGPVKPKLVVLLGDYGSNKSTQLKRITWETANASLNTTGATTSTATKASPRRYYKQVLPVYIHLKDLSKLQFSRGTLHTIILLHALKPFWPNIDEATAVRLIESKTGITLRVIIDGSDNLTTRERRLLWQNLTHLIQRYPHHQYIVALNSNFFERTQFDLLELHVLDIQKLGARKIHQFLETQTDHDSTSLEILRHLHDRQLFDLAAIPWFLTRMIQRAHIGDYPDSRTEVLQNLVEEQLTLISDNQGMRYHAEQFIYRMAWILYPGQQTIWPIDNAFQLMADIRGNRGYNLEDFYGALLRSGLIITLGEQYIRFAYAPVQAYCCANAIIQSSNPIEHLEDIITRFGRLRWLRWGHDTIVFVSGLLASKTESLLELLQGIVYGVDLLTSEQTFLAANSLLESYNERKRLGLAIPEANMELFDQVVNALVWRLDGQHETQLDKRIRAAELLGKLTASKAITQFLVDTILSKSRTDLSGRKDYDYSSMRMAAAVTLERMVDRGQANINHIDNDLIQLLEFWHQKHVVGLMMYFHDEVDIRLQSIAALILGDLQPQLITMVDHQADAHLILNELVDTFFNLTTNEVTLWSVTHALAVMDTMTITKRVIMQYLDSHRVDEFGEFEARYQRDKCLAYLIGRIRSQRPEAQSFLVDHCLKQCGDVGLWSTAIEALGMLCDPKYKSLLEQIAIGELSEINDSYYFFEQHQYFIRRKAIEALGNTGDLDTLNKLRAHKVNWEPDLRRAFYSTSEEIYWRLQQE